MKEEVDVLSSPSLIASPYGLCGRKAAVNERRKVTCDTQQAAEDTRGTEDRQRVIGCLHLGAGRSVVEYTVVVGNKLHEVSLSTLVITNAPVVRVTNHDQDHFVLRPQKRGCLLGTGTVGGGGGEGGERVKARPRISPEKDRRDRGPPPEQWKCYGGVPSPLRSD